jgi:hypothetical protein
LVYYLVLIAQGPLHLSPLQTAVRLAPCGVWGRYNAFVHVDLPLIYHASRFHYHCDMWSASTTLFYKENHRHRSGRLHPGEYTFGTGETIPEFLGRA